MGKRKRILIITGAVLAFAVALISFDAILLNRTRQALQQPDDIDMVSTVNGLFENFSTAEQSLTGEEDQAENKNILFREGISVDYNTPEYELELLLCGTEEEKNFISIKYYMDGASTERELGEEVLPELSGIFENRYMGEEGGKVFRISQVLLNPVHSGLYILVQEDSLQTYPKGSLYRINLKTGDINQILSYMGIFSRLSFNRDFSMMAYSFSDAPYLSKLQEDSIVEVLDCTTGAYIVKESRDMNRNQIGTNSNADYLYDYEFNGWESSSVLKLTQAVRERTQLSSKPVKTEVLYDIKKNLLMDNDGRELKHGLYLTAESGNATGGSTDGTEIQGTDGADSNGITGDEEGIENSDTTGDKHSDTEPVRLLKDFYLCLGSEENYSKAMNLLDSSFRLKMGMLKQFGVEEIMKSDIDKDSASLYSELLKAAKFDIIENVSSNGEFHIVTYYHKLKFGGDSDVRQLMSAHLKRLDKDWKIILIEDGVL